MSRPGLRPGFVIHDSLDTPGRLTASIREHLARQAPDAALLRVLRLRDHHEAAA